MTKVLFYLPYKLPAGRPSGSGVRPVSMLAAFKEIGIDAVLIDGESVERGRRIAESRTLLHDRQLLGIYAESSTMPMALTDPDHWPRHPCMDAAFFTEARRRGIPVGLFYRDVHWRFPIYRANVHWTKRAMALPFYKLELAQLSRALDILFLPSRKMMEHLPELSRIPVVEPLPPGGAIKDSVARASTSLKFIYVGGVVADVYDIRPMLEVFRRAPSVSLEDRKSVV